MAFELILTGDTFDEGRIKINDALSTIGAIWSAGTGSESIVTPGNNIANATLRGTAYGRNNVSSGNFSVAINDGNTAAGLYALVEGKDNFSSGDYSHVSGELSSGLTTASFTHGYGCLVDGNYSALIGSYNSEILNESTIAFIAGGVGNIIDEEGIIPSDNATILGGVDCIISGSPGSSIIASRDSSIYQTLQSAGHHKFSTIIGGEYHHMYNANTSSIAVGTENFISGTSESSSIIGSANSVIDFSKNSIISSSKGSSIITGAYANYYSPTSTNSAIVGGENNSMKKHILGIVPGAPEPISNSVIIAGLNGELSGLIDNGGIIGGEDNSIINVDNSSVLNFNNYILGGVGNVITNRNNSGTRDCIIIGGEYCKGLRPGIGVGTLDNTVVFGRAAQTTDKVGQGDNFVTIGYNVGTTASEIYNTIYFDMRNGNGYTDGTFYVGTADYAEYFEWNDGNLLNEKRYGYFVSSIEDKIEIGNSNIIGVISVSPGVAGDSKEFKWKDMFLHDEWGRKIIDKYEVYEVNSGQTKVYIDESENVYLIYPEKHNLSGVLYSGNTNDKVFVENKNIKRINPDYNTSLDYTSRKDRKEWSPVGLLGKLYVRTSEQITTNKVSVDTNGEAINGTDYHVLKSIKDYDGDYGIVQILFK